MFGTRGVGIIVAIASVALAPFEHQPPDQPSSTSSSTSISISSSSSTPTSSSSSTSTSSPTSSSTSSPTTVPPGPAIPPATWQRFDERIAAQLTGRGDRAASVAVSVGGHLVHAAAFGTRAPEVPDEGVTTTDRFRLASVSKVVTATVVLRLVDLGDLQLDEPVGQRLAGLVGVAPGNGVAGITVRQLLSHTSGFPDYRQQFFGDRFGSCEEAAAFGLARSLAHAPGTLHDYSNLNFCLLGLLVADVTGMPYQEAATGLLLRPLGITGMRLVATVDPNPDEVVHVSGADRTYMQSLGGAGAWVATPSDMVRILDSLDPANPGWHPLPEDLALLMHQALDVQYPEPGERRYGLGIVVWPDGSWGHTGTVENTHTMLVHRPDGVTWCILVSGDHPDSTERLRGVFDEAARGAGLTFG